MTPRPNDWWRVPHLKGPNTLEPATRNLSRGRKVASGNSQNQSGDDGAPVFTTTNDTFST